MIEGKILIVDLGHEDCTVLQDDLASIGIESVICSHDADRGYMAGLAEAGIKGVILNGGPCKTVGGFRVDAGEDIYSLDLPMYSVDHAGPAGVDLYSWPAERGARLLEVEYFLRKKCGFEI